MSKALHDGAKSSAGFAGSVVLDVDDVFEVLGCRLHFQ